MTNINGKARNLCSISSAAKERFHPHSRQYATHPADLAGRHIRDNPQLARTRVIACFCGRDNRDCLRETIAPDTMQSTL
jgi:hypothetical protein